MRLHGIFDHVANKLKNFLNQILQFLNSLPKKFLTTVNSITRTGNPLFGLPKAGNEIPNLCFHSLCLFLHVSSLNKLSNILQLGKMYKNRLIILINRNSIRIRNNAIDAIRLERIFNCKIFSGGRVRVTRPDFLYLLLQLLAFLEQGFLGLFVRVVLRGQRLLVEVF